MGIRTIPFSYGLSKDDAIEGAVDTDQRQHSFSLTFPRVVKFYNEIEALGG